MSDGRLDPVIRHATTEHPVHSLADFLIRRIRVLIQESLRRQDLPVLTVTALRYLLVDPGLFFFL